MASLVSKSDLSKPSVIPPQKVPSTDTITPAWLDPVGVICKLALLHFLPEGTKIRIEDREVRFDNPSYVQGIYRWYNGSSAQDLYNLSAPIFYAIKWLNPNQDPVAKRVFEFAQSGLKKLINQTYKGNLPTQQYLGSTHLLFIQKGLTGIEIDSEQYQIKNWSKNPLAEAAKDKWTNKDSPLKVIQDHFDRAHGKMLKGQTFHRDIGYIEEELSSINKFFKDLSRRIATGDSIADLLPSEKKPASKESKVDSGEGVFPSTETQLSPVPAPSADGGSAVALVESQEGKAAADAGGTDEF